MARVTIMALAGLAGVLAAPVAASAADAVMVQCGQQYQAAKVAGTLNGQDWGRFRVDCAARLKAVPAVQAVAATPVASPIAAIPVAATPAVVAPGTVAVPAAAPAGGGMAAMHLRQKRCGAEWTSNKVTLVAQTPGLTWPRYWSQCNTRLKAAGQ